MDLNELSQRYTGKAASTYNDNRVGGEKWESEQAAFRPILAGIERGANVLDVPVGTGRLIPFYKEFGLNLTGLDISEDMLKEASAAAEECGLTARFEKGDILRLQFDDRTFDAAIAIRLLNWIDTPLFRQAVRELARVSNRHVILGVRYLTSLRDIGAGKGGLLRWIRQKLGKAKRNMRRTGLVYHPKSAVMEAFRELGLVIEESRCVERRSDGTDYFIYRLAKVA